MAAMSLVKPALDIATIFPVGAEGEALANQITDRASFFREVKKLGGIMANAQQSRTKAAKLLNAAARLGVVHVGRGKSAAGDDAEKAYMDLATAHNAKGKGDDAFDALAVDAKGARSAISNFRSFATDAVLNQGEEFFDLVCRIAKSLGANCKLSPYMAMVRANTRCYDAQAKMVGKRMFIATSDDIAGWLQNAAPEEKTPDVRLEKLMRELTELSQEHDLGEDCEDRIASLLKAGETYISAYTSKHSKK